MRARPLVVVILFYIAGIILGRFFPALPFFPILLVLAALLCCRKILPLLAVSIVLAGFINYSTRYAVLSSSDLRVMFADREALVLVRGTLLEAPTIREYVNRNRTNYSSSARLRVSAVQREDQWEPASGVVMTSSAGMLHDRFTPGATVEIAGVLRPPASAMAEGLFDYREYLYNQRIFYQLRADASEDWALVSPAPTSFLSGTDRFQKWAQRQLSRGMPQDEILELIWSMTLGWKTGLDGSVADAFMRTGTMHIFAISGLHVACIAGVLVLVLRSVGFTRQHCGWVAVPLLWFYTIVTGWQSTAVRSALMSTVLILGWAMKRPTDMLNSTAAAGLIILLIEPEQLFQASFQLSFLVVASMGLFLPALEQMRRRALAPDDFLPPELRPKWQQAMDMPVRAVTTNFTVSFASWIGSLPLVAWYFNINTPISLLANLLAVPLSSLALTASMLSLALPPLGPVFNFFSYAYMWETVVVTQWFAAIPWGYFYVPKPNLLFFVFFYASVILAVRVGHLRPSARVFGATLCALFGIAWVISAVPGLQEAKITMLPINGAPLVVDLPGRNGDLLVDCSDERNSDFVLKRFLRAQGVGTIANMLVTHGDINHAGGHEIVWKEFTPKNVFTSHARARSPTYRRMIEELEKGFLTWKPIERGDEIAEWRVVHPGAEHFSRADDNSVALKGEVRGWRILLLSELGRSGQRELARSGENLAADIVFCGAPEQGEPLEADLFSQVRPRLVLLGNTAGRVNGRAESRIVKRLRRAGATIFTTSRHGSISLEFQEERCIVTTGSEHRLVLER